MTRSALVLQFGATAPPGLLADWLRDRGLAMTVHHVGGTDPAPNPRDHAFVACLGARWSPADIEQDEVIRARAIVVNAVDADVPVLGLCFGGQLLASVLGGEITDLAEPELGWYDIESDDPSIAAGPWLQWHWHGFTVPPGAQEIARSSQGSQAFRHGRHLGLQFHPESTIEIVSAWARIEQPRLAAQGIPDGVAVLEQGRGHAAAAAHNARQLFDGFWAQADNGGKRMAQTEAEVVPSRADLLADPRVTTVRVLYPDLHGIARGKDVPIAEFHRLARHGLGFCSAVMATDLRHTPVLGAAEGFPDLQAVPDVDTFMPVPWEPEVVACLTNLQPVPNGPEIADPRGALRRIIAGFEELDLAPQIGPELEFFLLERDPAAPGGVRRRVDQLSRVYTVGPQVDPGGFVRRLTEQLSAMGIGAFAANHEYYNSQYEINLHHGDALDAADRAFILKNAVKDVAALNGMVATFIGKPFNDQGGSGQHLHVSLARDGENVFADPNGDHGISDEMRWFLGGVMRHAPASMAFLNPTINAYRRLVPDSLAPTQANWGWDNRSAFARVPAERGRATRLEVRVGDGAANPYLAIAALLQAGLHGLRDRIEPPAPTEGDAYRDTGGAPLPQSLDEALDALEADEVLMNGIGPEITEPFLAIKRFEIERHRAWVSDWELAEYLHHL